MCNIMAYTQNVQTCSHMIAKEIHTAGWSWGETSSYDPDPCKQ